MARPTPLPDTLQQLPFTVYESRALGVTEKRLRAKDLADGGRLIYLPQGRVIDLRDRPRYWQRQRQGHGCPIRPPLSSRPWGFRRGWVGTLST